MKHITIIALSLLAVLAAGAKPLSPQAKKSIDSLLNTGLWGGYYPGASVAIGGRGGIVYEKRVGWQDTSRSVRLSPDDVYDIASLTKIVATTYAVMRLYDEGRIGVNKFIGDYLHDYDGTPIEKIPLSQLLTHTSGLPYFPAYSLLYENPTGEKLTQTKQDSTLYPRIVDRGCYLCADARGIEGLVSKTPVEGYRQAGDSTFISPAADSVINAKIKDSYNAKLRGRYRYSDTNFYILRQIIEQITGESFEIYTRMLFDELEMTNTGFRPMDWADPLRIIPTEYDYLLQRGLVRGYVHDDLSAANAGVEGNAGVFSTARDLARFCRMMIAGGSYKGRRILNRATINLFTSQPLLPKKIYRGLGFDKRDPESPLYNGYGHTGYTGTMIWIDPSIDFYMVFLSNRVHPSRISPGLSASGLRTKIWEVIKKDAEQ